jgi:hypothetical protein
VRRKPAAVVKERKMLTAKFNAWNGKEIVKEKVDDRKRKK